MKKQLPFLILFSLLLSLFSCKDKSEDFSCIQLSDINGQPIGSYGSCSITNHWGNIPLTDAEKAYFDSADNIDMSDTENTSILEAYVYPNPVQLGGTLYFNFASDDADKLVKIKLALVDDKGRTKFQAITKQNRTTGIAIQLPESQFNAGTFYRLYYHISSKDDSSLLEGYGNILICNDPIADISECL